MKDLVNQLQQDNEVLQESNQDLKYAFHFLLQKHKQVQHQLAKEQAKNALLLETEKRLAEVSADRDKAVENGMKLSDKVGAMSQIVQLALEE